MGERTIYNIIKLFLICLFSVFSIHNSIYAGPYDGDYSSQFAFKMSSQSVCPKELPVDIQINIKDNIIAGYIFNKGNPENGNAFCKLYHNGEITGEIDDNGKIVKLKIRQKSAHSRKYSSYKIQGYLDGDSTLISSNIFTSGKSSGVETVMHYHPSFKFRWIRDESKQDENIKKVDVKQRQIELEKKLISKKKKEELNLVLAQKESEKIKSQEEAALIKSAKEKKNEEKIIEGEMISKAKERHEEEKKQIKNIERKLGTWDLKELDIFLTDMKKFVAQNKKALDAISLIKLLRPVNVISKKKIITSDDIDKINALNNFLMKNEDFRSYRNNKLSEREGERLRVLAISQGKLQAVLDFCLAYVNNNTLADEAYEVTLLYRAHIDNTKSKDKKVVENSILEVNKKLIALGLKQTQVKKKTIVKSDEKKEIVAKNKPKTKPNRNIDDKVSDSKKKKPVINKKKKSQVKSIKILKNYQDKDILLYVNLLSSAPHAYRDLEGNIKFENKILNICWAHNEDIDASYMFYLNLELEKKYKNHTINLNKKCSIEDKEKLNSVYDGIIFSKELFLKHKYIKIKNIISLINDGDYYQDFILAHNNFKKYWSKREIISTQIEEDVLDGNRNGFGSIIVKNKSNIVCLIVEDKIDAHEAIIMRGKISSEYQLIQGRKLDSIIKVSIENGFKQAQRGNCGLLYSESKNLAKLYKALKNIKIKYETIPDWVSVKNVDKTYQAIISKENKDIQANVERIAEEKLRQSEENARNKKDKKLAKAKQAELRSVYQPKISAIIDEFNKLLLNKGIEGLYPDFKIWFEDRKKSGWEEDKNKSVVSIIDYGQVTWGSDRVLEGDIISMTMSLKNRDQGIRKEHCFLFSKIVDVEFNMYREARIFNCSETDMLDKWKRSFSFESLWNVEGLNNN